VETLREIDRAILAAQSPEAIVRATLERVGPLVGCLGAGIMVFDWQVGEAWVLAFLDLNGRRAEFEQRLPLAALSLLESYRRGECHIVDDIEALSPTSSPERMMLAQGVRSYVLAPLIAGDALVGALVLGSTEPAYFASERVEIAQEVAGSLAVAIQQARLREELQQRTAQVEASLQEKEAMLQEIHHRVKNNLQIISSLLNLQSQQIEDERMLTVFADSRDRVQSMAIVHETLYHSPNLDRVDLGEYIRSLTSYLMRAHRGSTGRVSLKLDVADVSLGVDSAIPCGLIINELVSNALKHAFPEGSESEIYVGLHVEQPRLILEVRDNGVGLPSDIDVHDPRSLGLQLVNTLVQQLEGTLQADSRQGTTFRFAFEPLGYRQRS
jgi:two-component sensor histidine kinase